MYIESEAPFEGKPRNMGSGPLEKWYFRKTLKISWTGRVTNEEVLDTRKENDNYGNEFDSEEIGRWTMDVKTRKLAKDIN